MSKFPIPNSCPICNSLLQTSSTNIDLICTNFDCPAQVSGRLSYFCQRNIANITGISEKTIELLIQKFQLKDIYDLYDLPFEEIQLLDNFGEKSVNNLNQAIQKSRKLEDYKFLAGLGIDGVGIEISKLICTNMQSN